jgi:hypothetical protein
MPMDKAVWPISLRRLDYLPRRLAGYTSTTGITYLSAAILFNISIQEKKKQEFHPSNDEQNPCFRIISN